MNLVQITINKLIASYSSNCHFKIKIVSNSSPNKESAENKHSFKYDKSSSEVSINEKLELNINDTLSFEHKFQFFLQVYTKSGYKINSDISDQRFIYDPPSSANNYNNFLFSE